VSARARDCTEAALPLLILSSRPPIDYGMSLRRYLRCRNSYMLLYAEARLSHLCAHGRLRARSAAPAVWLRAAGATTLPVVQHFALPAID
jgi:hypothetical protein